MTEVETGKIIAVIAEVYPTYFDKRSVESTVKLWHMLFAEDGYKEVEAALMAFIATDEKGFPPPPGKIRSILAEYRIPDADVTETEAWAMVAKATRNALYNSGSEFEALPPEIQRVVGSAAMLREWALMDTDTFNSVVSSNFMRSYRARTNHMRETAKLPPAVKDVLCTLSGALSLENKLSSGAHRALPDAKQL